jgi:hypothetical protein
MALLDAAAGEAAIQIELPSPGTLLWSAGFETGNVTEWYFPSTGPVGNYGGGVFNSGSADSAASMDYAHTGQWSLRQTISAPPLSGARMFRWLEPQLYPELHYSAWFYFPERYSVGTFWNVFQWKSKRSSVQIDPFFVLNVGNRPDGTMFLYLYDWQTQRGYSQSVKDIPVGRWFRIEADYRCAGDNGGRVTFWQDGVQLFDVGNVQTRYADGDCQWSLDNYSDGLSPSPATVYVDDAAITIPLALLPDTTPPSVAITAPVP